MLQCCCRIRKTALVDKYASIPDSFSALLSFCNVCDLFFKTICCLLTPLINVANVAMSDTLADCRFDDDGQRTVRPDTLHGGKCDRKQSNSNADARKEVLPPPPFQRLSNQNGKSGDNSQSGGSGDLPPPADSKGPWDGYDVSVGHESADHPTIETQVSTPSRRQALEPTRSFGSEKFIARCEAQIPTSHGRMLYWRS
jgi:hypothetical protein